MPTGTPTLRMKARVVRVGGVRPTDEEFSFALAKFTNAALPLTPTYEVTGGEETPWMVIDAAAAVALYDYYRSLIFHEGGERKQNAVFQLTVDGVPADTYVTVAGLIQIDETRATNCWAADVYAGTIYRPHVQFMAYRHDGADNLPTDDVTPGIPAVKTLWQFAKRFGAAVRANVPTALPRPSQFILGDFAHQGDQDRMTARENYRTLARLGANTVLFQPGLDRRDIVRAGGHHQVMLVEYAPPGYAFLYSPPVVGPNPPTPAGFAAWATGYADAVTEAGFSVDEVPHFAQGDEPGWYYPTELTAMATGSGMRDAQAWTDAKADFRAFLVAQGLTDSDVGTISTALPVGRSKMAGTRAERLLYFWSMRWFSDYSARHSAAASAAFETEFPGCSIAVNENNFAGRFIGTPSFAPSPEDPDSGLGSHDWLDVGRHGAGTTVFSADYVPDVQAWMGSVNASRKSSAARQRPGMRSGSYIIGSATGIIPGVCLREHMVHVAHGETVLIRYSYGPEYIANDGYAERLRYRPLLSQEMAQASAMIAFAEDILMDGSVPDSDVAILYPRTAQPYDPVGTHDSGGQSSWMYGPDYLAEALGIGTALIHAGVRPDWVADHDDLAAKLASCRYLFVTSPNVTAAGQTAIAAWANAGGVLITTAGAGRRDEANDPLSTINSLGGITETAHDRHTVVNFIAAASYPVSGTLGDTTAYADYGVEDWRTVATPGGATVEATFTDTDDPAFLHAPVGSGHRFHFPWYPGLSYIQSQALAANVDPSQLPTGWNAVTRSMLTRPLVDHVKAVDCSAAVIDVGLILAADADKAAVVAVNWGRAALGSTDFAVPLPFTPVAVESAKLGVLSFTFEAGVASFSAPLADADIVTLRAA